MCTHIHTLKRLFIQSVLDMVVHTCDPNTQKTEEIKATLSHSLDYMILCLKTTTNVKNNLITPLQNSL